MPQLLKSSVMFDQLSVYRLINRHLAIPGKTDLPT